MMGRVDLSLAVPERPLTDLLHQTNRNRRQKKPEPILYGETSSDENILYCTVLDARCITTRNTTQGNKYTSQ